MDIEEALNHIGNGGRFQIFMMVIYCLSNAFVAGQLVLMVIVGATPNLNIPSERNLTTIVTEWNLYDKQWIVDLASSMFMVGYAFGVTIFGQLSDLYGRKYVFIFNYTLACVSSMCGTFCQQWETFIVTRTFTGFFIGAIGHVLFVLVLENVTKKRWDSIGMFYQTFFSMGVMMFSSYGYIFLNWRHVCLFVSLLPTILIPIFMFVMPKSSRWLYHVGKVEEAEKVVQYIARLNGQPYKDIKLSYETTSDKPRDLNKYSIIDLFKNSTLAIYALCSFYICLDPSSALRAVLSRFACSFVYYGLTLDASVLSPNIFIAILLSSSVEVPAVFLGYLGIRHRWFGRKGTMMACFALSVISNVGLLFSIGLNSENLSTVQTVLGLINKLAVTAAFGILYLYVAEIFPTQLRVVAIGGSSLFARVGAIIAPFVPLLAPIASYLPYIVFGIAAVVWGILNLFLPETLNKPTPDMRDFTMKKNESNGNAIRVNQDSYDQAQTDESVQHLLQA